MSNAIAEEEDLKDDSKRNEAPGTQSTPQK